jgi:glycosyltransferase involved in cell wall biosynthesis
MTALRIALFHNLPSGGAKRHTREQARELARRGHEVVEICPGTAEVDLCSLAPFTRERRVVPFTAPPLAARIPAMTPYVHLAQGLVLLRRLDALQRHIATAIDQGGFDVVLAQDCRFAMAPHVLRHLTTRSAYFCHHGFEHWGAARADAADGIRAHLARRWFAPARWLGSTAWHRAETRNARAAGVILTASGFASTEVQRHYGKAARVVGAGVDTAVFAPADDPAGDYVLTVGELTPRKQHRFLVAALAQIPAPRRPRLLIAANMVDANEAGAVRAQAAAAGVALQVERITDDGELARVYRRARAVVFAARGEMLGLVCLEAMSCGTPVVAVGEGGVPEMIRDGVTGCLTGRDVRAFAAALDALLADEARRRRMAAAAAEHVRHAWTWSAAGDRLAAALAPEGGGSALKPPTTASGRG